MPSERRLAAIMFTDIVGYTALMARDEEAGRRARDRHEAVVRPLVERHSGKLIEAAGDESLSRFPSALDAVTCALAVQDALREDDELRVRIGIHLGDVTFEGERVSGDGVNVAARVRPLAEPGGICVSDQVQQSLRGRTDLEFASLGEQELKNVGRPVGVYAVGRPGTVTVSRASKARALSWKRARSAIAVLAVAVAALIAWRIWDRVGETTRAPIRSIAVLPLENLGDPDQERVADGVTDALIESLARVGPELRVISRTSVMQYKGATKPARQIADELGVEFLIEGTAQRQDDRVLIRVQLIEALNDAHLWAESYERDLRDFFRVQREIARAVAGEIHVTLSPERERLGDTRPVDPQALDAYLRGLQLRGQMALVVSWGPAAIKQFERAVELDPAFTDAWVKLARARVSLGAFGVNLRYRSEFPAAREAAQRAVELDESQGSAHAVLGLVLLRYDWDFPDARRAFEQAVQLSPSSPIVLDGYRTYLAYVGRIEEARDFSERLVRVAPLDPYYLGHRFSELFYARQYESALEEANRVRTRHPDFVHFDIPWIYVGLGRFEEAHRALIALEEQCGALCDAVREARERGWVQDGWEGSLRAVLEVVIEIDGFPPFAIALNFAAIGELDEAIDWLERGYRERDPLMTVVKAWPTFDPLRSDPRFDDLLRRIGFPED
jgi:TolB-like protein/class 3 adenylate cyclase